MKTWILCCLLAVAFGMSEIQSGNSSLYKDLDFDGNGILERNELMACYTQIDTNGDGRKALIEYTANLPIRLTPIGVKASFNYYDELDGQEEGVINQSVVHFIYQMLNTNNLKMYC